MIIDLSPAQAADRITALLAAPESRTLEFKRISAKHARMIGTLCAFANIDGGLVVIGVGDAKDLKPGAKPESRLFGIEENPEAFALFRRQVMQRFEPPMTQLHWIRVPCTLNKRVGQDYDGIRRFSNASRYRFSCAFLAIRHAHHKAFLRQAAGR